MKTTYLLAIFVFIITGANAQTSSTAIRYKKSLQPALKIDLPGSSEDVEATILEKLRQTGYLPETSNWFFRRSHKVDGFYAYKNVLLPLPNTRHLDIYFKVVVNDKQKINSNRLYMLVSTGNENFSSPQGDSTIWNGAILFLQSFMENTAAYSLSQDIQNQEKMISDSRITLSKLVSDQLGMENSMKKLGDDMFINSSNVESQKAEISYQLRILDTLKGKRK